MRHRDKRRRTYERPDRSHCRDQKPFPPGPWGHWNHEHKFPKWRRRRGWLFLRFAGAFGLIALLVVGGMTVLAFLLSQWFEGDGRMAVMLWMGGCGLTLAMPALATAVALRLFRGVTTPLADVMAAADAVAEGDLSVRVEEPKHSPDEFQRLVTSFNRMTQELEQADQQRRNMTADVAHELRTPLHIIQGNLEGVLDDVYTPTNEHIVATLEETHHLARLVEDLRTLSLAEAGQLPLRQEPVDVRELLADAQTSFSGQAEAAGVDLRVETSADLPTIIGDVDRLDQVLNNLIANALRHTPPSGTITLRAAPIEDGLRLVVRDTGEGIPVEDLPYIFDRFWHGDGRVRTSHDHSPAQGTGTGLGLAIARQLVQAHGGTIHVESETKTNNTRGSGTTFTIDLPI